MPPVPNPLPRLIVYYQTHHTPSGQHISVLPLTQKEISLTHLIVAAIHINEDPNALTLNDHSPDHPRFTTLWAELRVLQACGIKVLGMLGGAAKGSYMRLDGDAETFERYYAPLAQLVRERGLDGLDLDVEEEMSLRGIIRLIDRLRKDFGPEFIITLAPVATAMTTDLKKYNLSGFDYWELERERGKDIAWYNVQFYCGWGHPSMYSRMARRREREFESLADIDKWPARKLVVGLVTNPGNGNGFVEWQELGSLLVGLAASHESFGGVMGWEYFNSMPGGESEPWRWAQMMTALLRGWTIEPLPEGQQQAAQQKAALNDGEAAIFHTDAYAEEDGHNSVAAPVPGEFEYYSDWAEGA